MHEDVPSNNWQEVLACAELYRQEIANQCSHINASTMTVGRSFYERNFPSRILDLGYSFTALHWQSEKVMSPDTSVLEAHAMKDLTTFLRLRAQEFKAGGILVLGYVSTDAAVEPVSHRLHIGAVMNDMVKEGLLTEADLGHMAPPTHMLEKHSQQQVFDSVGDVWELLHFDVQLCSTPLWGLYQSGEMSLQDYAQAYSSGWRAILEPSFVSGLQGAGYSSEAAEKLVDEYFQKLTQLAMQKPVPMEYAMSRVMLKRKPCL